MDIDKYCVNLSSLSKKKQLKIIGIIEYIYRNCEKSFQYIANAELSTGLIDVDLLVEYNQIPICVIQYATSDREYKQLSLDFPKILRITRIPIGILINYDDTIQMYESDKNDNINVTEKEMVISLCNVASKIPNRPDLAKAKKILMEIFNNSDDFANKMKINDVFEKVCDNLQISNGQIITSESFENVFFRTLLGEIPNKSICRYTSIESLFNTLCSKRQSLCGIVSMNDPFEISYADSKMSWYTEWNRGEVEIDIDNNIFILSCCSSDNMDNLLMWRLYGDDAKGACIEYTLDKTRIDFYSIFLAPVNYGERENYHPELKLISDLQNIELDSGWYFKFNEWNIWKYFFKSANYKEEKEIRMLFVPDAEEVACESKWFIDRKTGIFNRMLLFPMEYDSKNILPITLKKIILGPKSPSLDRNIEQIWLMSNEIDTDQGFTVVKSSIKNYR